MTSTPKPTNVTPDQTDKPVVRVGRWDSFALSCWRDKPKRPTAKSIPINPSPVRIQAKKVLSCEVNSRVLLCTFVHPQIVMKIQTEYDLERDKQAFALMTRAISRCRRSANIWSAIRMVPAMMVRWRFRSWDAHLGL